MTERDRTVAESPDEERVEARRRDAKLVEAAIMKWCDGHGVEAAAEGFQKPHDDFIRLICGLLEDEREAWGGVLRTWAIKLRAWADRSAQLGRHDEAHETRVRASALDDAADTIEDGIKVAPVDDLPRSGA